MVPGDDSSAQSSAPPIVVGMGASAGGLEALFAFFQHLPADTRISFVVVMHQHPSHTSMVAELLARHTTMTVKQVEDGDVLLPEHVYIAPPGSSLDVEGGRLRVVHPAEGPQRAAIDHFFRSLAHAQKERAIGIILSGAGSDGTIGLKEIKAASGMVMVQDEASAKYAGMPHSAIATTLVDYVLPVEKIPEHLLAYVRGPFFSAESRGDEPGTAGVIETVVDLIRSHTGNDFSCYKLSTLRRRIERRMNVHLIHSSEDYVRLLQQNTTELRALFQELLIGVTSFFRDPDAFAALGSALDSLLLERPRDTRVRAWVAGCATGEEAYSVAMLLRETLDHRRLPFELQVFATDLDQGAIEVARGGLFPESVAGDISAERLDRFFTREERGYRVKKDIRDVIVFAPHNLLKHPPFTKVDLIVCRNVLIYLNSDAQAGIFPLFHYALRPHGILFLGPSESLGHYGELFERIDPRWKLFARRPPPASYTLAHPGRGFAQPVQSPHARHAVNSKAIEPGPTQLVNRLLLDELVPPTVLVNERGDIFHVHGKTGRFLEPATGAPAGANVLQMARPGLELHLAAVIRQALATGEGRRRNIRVQTNGDVALVDLRSRRVDSPRVLQGFVLIGFELAAEVAPAASGTEGEPPDQLGDLRRELEMTRESHQAAMEQLETTNEELTSTNEELQSTNEELQSTNEELETSREEMQSLNEELQTLNSEMQSKLDELSRANDDMQNLLNSTDVAVLFLDLQLNVKRYTLQATKVFNLIPADIGRPITDLVSKLHYDRLAEDAREVLDSLVYREIEVRDRDWTWYLMRILPYRMQGNRIGGLVITFFETTRLKLLQELESGLQNAMERLPVTVLGQDRDLRIVWAQTGALGIEAAALRGKLEEDFLPPAEAAAITALKRRVLDTGVSTRAEVSMTVVGRGLTQQDLWIQPVRDGRGAVSGVLSIAVDVTGKREDDRVAGQLRSELAVAQERYAELQRQMSALTEGKAGPQRPRS